jgi:tetratricopeptide (TPR) repeat protein
LGTRSNAWIEELESALFNGNNAALLLQLLPPFYAVLDVPDRAARTQRLQQRAIQLLIKDKLFAQALAALNALPERQPKLEAVCQEGLGDFRSAAECHLAAGNHKEALRCYRSIPDLESALKMVGEIGEHPAAESLQWISRLQQLVAERPEKFTKMVTPAEKELLEELLERALGVSRRQLSPRKTTKKKPLAPRKRVQRRTGGRGEPYF